MVFGVADDGDTAVVGHVQPLVGIGGPGIGELDAFRDRTVFEFWLTISNVGNTRLRSRYFANALACVGRLTPTPKRPARPKRRLTPPGKPARR